MAFVTDGTVICNYKKESGAEESVLSIPDGVTEIGYMAFTQKQNIKEIVFPDSLMKINDRAFFDCHNLKRIVFSGKIAAVGEEAFSYCRSLEAVILPDGTESIGNNAFLGCSALTEIKFPDTLKSIGSRAFSECYNLKQICLPASVNFIGEYAFSGCAALESISVAEENSEYSSVSGSLYNKDKSTLILCPRQRKDTKFDFPKEVRRIENSAFNMCRNLTSVIIPGGMEYIGEYAFMGCDNLRSVVIPDSVKYIGTCAFCKTAWYDSLVPDKKSGTVIVGGSVLLKYVTDEAEVTVPDGVKCLADVFRDNNRIKKAVLPAGLEYIAGGAFSGCKSLSEVIIPDTVKMIGKGAFYYCVKLKMPVLPESLEYIGESAFQSSGIEKIGLPANVSYIGRNAFESCRNAVGTVIVPEKVEIINNETFQGCWGITDVILPQGLKRINDRAFNACGKLKHINFPAGVEYIGDYAFCTCTLLEGNINVPSGTEFGHSALYGCNNAVYILPDDYSSMNLENAFVRKAKLKFTRNNRNFYITMLDDHKHDEELLFEFLKEPTGEGFSKIKKGAYKIALAIGYFDCNDSIAEYFRKNIKKAVRAVIDENDAKTLSALLETEYITKSNIDSLIEYAESGSLECKMLLMHYKDEKVGYTQSRFTI